MWRLIAAGLILALGLAAFGASVAGDRWLANLIGWSLVVVGAGLLTAILLGRRRP